MNNNKKIFLKGIDRTSSIKRYKYSGGKFWITFTDGKTYPYSYHDVKVIELSKEEQLINSHLEYFRDIANNIGIKNTTENGRVINVLASNYAKIDKIDKKTILYNFLSGEEPLKPQKPKDELGSFFKIINSRDKNADNNIIYPFGFNLSQKIAVEKAIENKLSTIEGPPGTGKTQTILNIIANIVSRGESVAVVSSNNSATKNIVDKLKKYDVNFIAAYLGNNENKQDFINSQIRLPDIQKWYLEDKEINNLYLSLNSKYKLLQEMLSKQTNLAKLKQELNGYEIEIKHHKALLENFEIKHIPPEISNIKSWQKAIEMSYLFDVAGIDFKKPNPIIEIIKNILEFFKIVKFKKTIIIELLKKYDKNYLIALCEERFYEIKTNEIKEEILNIKEKLEYYDFNEKMKEYSELSAKIFRAKLAQKYQSKNREIYTINDLLSKSEKFIKDYPVILSTTYSLRSCLSNDVMYDYVIVDEASQVDLATGVLALSCAKKAVIVGDLKQLPNVVDNNIANITDKIFNNHNIPEIYRYKNHCLLSCISGLFPAIPNTLLKEHYRCHPQIIEFCNKKFYNNQLVILSNIDSNKKPLMVYKTAKGNQAANNINQRQIDVIKNEIIPNEGLCVDDESLGIVTPYRNQTNALHKAFCNTKVKADTVDKFQGQENKVIILSTVDNQITDFTDNPNRLNVAISRAIEQLIVVINGNEPKRDTNMDELVKYIEYNNCEIKESKVYSVFDNLYKCYEEERIKLLKKYPSISAYVSENLMYSVIRDVLKNYNNIDVVSHFPLNMIIKDTDLMTKEEFSYANNDWTHVDFLIYNKIDKKPLLAIEVDGYKFHNLNDKQAKRDLLKNSIFEKYGIKLLRFSTKGSNEEQRLTEILKELMK